MHEDVTEKRFFSNLIDLVENYVFYVEFERKLFLEFWSRDVESETISTWGNDKLIINE